VTAKLSIIIYSSFLRLRGELADKGLNYYIFLLPK